MTIGQKNWGSRDGQQRYRTTAAIFAFQIWERDLGSFKYYRREGSVSMQSDIRQNINYPPCCPLHFLCDLIVFRHWEHECTASNRKLKHGNIIIIIAVKAFSIHYVLLLTTLSFISVPLSPHFVFGDNWWFGWTCVPRLVMIKMR